MTDSDGDYMLLIGWWAGMVKGTLPTIGTKTTRGKSGEPGNPGYLCVQQIDLRTGQVQRYNTKEGISISFGIGRSFSLTNPTTIMLQKDEKKPLQFIGGLITLFHFFGSKLFPVNWKTSYQIGVKY